ALLFHPIFDLDSPALDLFEEGVGGDISFLQDCAALADCSGAHHLQDDGGGEGGGAHHSAHIALGIVVVDHGEGGDSAFELAAEQAANSRGFDRFVGFEAHDANVGALAGKFSLEHFGHERAGSDFHGADSHFLVRKQAQVLQLAEQIVVAGIAQGFFETLSHSSLESFGQGGSSSGSLKGDERSEAFHVKFLGLGERVDSDQLAFAQNACGFYVFVDQSFHGKHELIVKGRHGFFGQASDVEFERVGASVEAANQLSSENRCHTGRKAAIR